jgi:hypothetical protein
VLQAPLFDGRSLALLELFDYWRDSSERLRQYLWAHRTTDLDRARRLIEVLPAETIIAILRYLVDDYWGRYVGWPDLMLWRDEAFLMVEVKSSSDKLSADQMRWIADNHEMLSRDSRRMRDLSLLAATLRDRGAWIPVLMDAEARKRAKAEGLRIAERLAELGVDIYCAHADTGTTVEETANRLSTGRLRVHEHLEEWFAGYRRYRRDEKGEIVEADDHLMRATGLMLVHGLGLAVSENRAASEAEGVSIRLRGIEMSMSARAARLAATADVVPGVVTSEDDEGILFGSAVYGHGDPCPNDLSFN